jgi:hypothetical protein
MLIMGHPQFATQDDLGAGDGIPPISEWQLDIEPDDDAASIGIDDAAVANVYARLRNVLRRARRTPLPATQLHDLTSFVVHRLLLTAGPGASTATTECLRYGMVLFMFVVQGPTYYSHDVMLNTMIGHLGESLRAFVGSGHGGALLVWLAAVGMAASVGTPHYYEFAEAARMARSSVQQLRGWADVCERLGEVLWLQRPDVEAVFRPHWDFVLEPSAGAEVSLPRAVGEGLGLGAYPMVFEEAG